MKKIIILILLALSSITYGQLSQINVGTSANDGTGESLRSAFQKVNLGITQINTNTGNILLRLPISDTTLMLTKYARKASPTFTGTVSGITAAMTGAMATSHAANAITGTDISNWGTAYTDRLKWDGGSTGLTAATGRSSLGGTTAGQALFTLTNPSAITFLRINADNTVTALSAANFRTATATVGTADTASMLTPYITDIEARNAINDSITARLNGATEISDIVVMLADSTGNAPGNYVTRKALSDSIAANAGSVAGITLNGGTLTLTGGDALTFETGGDYSYTLPQTSGGTLMLMSEIQAAINDSLEARLIDAIDISTVLDDYEPSLGNPASDGYVLSSTSAGVRSWVQSGAGASYDSTYIHYRVDSLTTVVSNLQSELTSLIDAINRLDLGDITPPRFLSAEIGTYSDSIVVMLMDTTDILQDSVPLASHFALTEGGIGVGIDTVTINIDTVFIALDSTLTAGTTLLLDYTSGYPALQDSSGNKTVSWENKVVTNNITASAPSTLLTGLISYYSFEEESGDLIDLHGSHDGTVGGSVYGGTGKIGNCYTFTATAGQGVTLPTSTDFNLAGTTGSISVWFITSVGSYSRGWIAGTKETYATLGYGMYIDSEAPSRFKTSVGSSGAEIAYTVDMAASASWHHAVMTWDVDGNLITYLDGTQVDSREITITPADDSSFTIGVNADGYNPIVFKGSIDELAIYNRVLTSDEVTELNNSGNGKNYDNF